MTKSPAKVAITNTCIIGTFRDTYALSCDFEGHRYHVWINQNTDAPDKPTLFQNPPLGTEYHEPGYYSTIRLGLDGDLGRKLLPAMLAMRDEQNLVQKWLDLLANKSEQEQRDLAIRQARKRITESAPQLAAALIEARKRLLVVCPADAEPMQQIDAALRDAGVIPHPSTEKGQNNG